MLIYFLATDAMSKFNTDRLPWQPAGNNEHKLTSVLVKLMQI